MEMLYDGPAPGLAAGVCQIDAIVPKGAVSGENLMQILAGPNTSPAITFWVK